MVKTLTILGARPQFIKASPVLKLLKNDILVHTGQHYDDNMSDIFFSGLNIKDPDYNLDISGGMNSDQVKRMTPALSAIMEKEKPDCVIVYGDTNSTLAGAYAAKMNGIKLVHIEAGLRSYNWDMPEEKNRVITDILADVLICPTALAMKNLSKEKLEDKAYLCGDTMFDLVLENMFNFKVECEDYYLLTLHRPVNVDSKEKMKIIFNAIAELDIKVIFPCHPRTLDNLIKFDIVPAINIIEPVGYMEMMKLAANAKRIITDSGGLQKEAHMLGVPCVTLRSETEWKETVIDCMNRLTCIRKNEIVKHIKLDFYNKSNKIPSVYGDGHAASKIVGLIND